MKKKIILSILIFCIAIAMPATFFAEQKSGRFRYEVEDYAKPEQIKTNEKGFTGVGYVNVDNNFERLEIAVSALSGGNSEIAIGYINRTGNPCSISVYLNGEHATSFELKTSSNFKISDALPIELLKGENKLELVLEKNQKGGFLIDYIEVYKADEPIQSYALYQPVRNTDSEAVRISTSKIHGYKLYEAEKGEPFSGGRVNTDQVGFSGDGVVALTKWYPPDGALTFGDNCGFRLKNIDGFSGGKRSIIIGYNNGHKWAQAVHISVNGKEERILLPPIAIDEWNAFGYTEFEFELKKGAENEIEIKCMDSDMPTSFNIDYIGVELDSGPWQDVVTKIELQIDNSTAKLHTVGGKIKEETLEAAPTIKMDRTFVPISFIAKNLDAQTDWDNEKRRVTVQSQGITIKLTIDDRIAYRNGRTILLDEAPYIKNGRTMVPLRFLSENFGFLTQYDNESRTISIEKQ